MNELRRLSRALVSCPRLACLRSAVLPVVAVMAALTSCMDFSNDIDKVNDPSIGWYPDAIVTVKTAASGKTFFQLDEETTLEPEGWSNPFKSETRALLYYSEIGESEDFSVKVRVERIDSVLTKDALAHNDKDVMKSDDPVEVVKDWLTVCEDGYLTIHFATLWGSGSVPHKVALVADKDNSRLFHFRHDSDSDQGTVWKEGIVAFWIGDLVPVASGEDANITLDWESFSGREKMVFKYRKRED